MNTYPSRKEHEGYPVLSGGGFEGTSGASLTLPFVATPELPSLLLELSRKGFAPDEGQTKGNAPATLPMHLIPNTLSPGSSSIPQALFTLCFDLHDFGDLSSDLPMEEDEEEWDGTTPRNGEEEEGMKRISSERASPLHTPPQGESGSRRRMDGRRPSFGIHPEKDPRAISSSSTISMERGVKGNVRMSTFDPMHFIRCKCQEGASLEALAHDLGTFTSVLQAAIATEVAQKIPPAVMHEVSLQSSTLRKEIQQSLPFELSDVARGLEEACEGLEMNLLQVKEKIEAASLAAAQQYFDSIFLRVLLLYDALAVLGMSSVSPPSMEKDGRNAIPCGGVEGNFGVDNPPHEMLLDEDEESSDDTEEEKTSRRPPTSKTKKSGWKGGYREGNGCDRPFPFFPPSPPPPPSSLASRFAYEDVLRNGAAPSPSVGSGDDPPLSSFARVASLGSSPMPASREPGNLTASGLPTTSGVADDVLHPVQCTSSASQTRRFFSRLHTLQRAVGILGVLHEIAGKEWGVFQPREEQHLQTSAVDGDGRGVGQKRKKETNEKEEGRRGADPCPSGRAAATTTTTTTTTTRVRTDAVSLPLPPTAGVPSFSSFPDKAEVSMDGAGRMDPLAMLLAVDSVRASEAAQALGWCQAAENAILNEMRSMMAEVGRLYFQNVQQDFQCWEKERIEKRNASEVEVEEQEEKARKEGGHRGREAPPREESDNRVVTSANDTPHDRDADAWNGLPRKDPATDVSSFSSSSLLHRCPASGLGAASTAGHRGASRSFLSLVTSSSSRTSCSGSMVLMHEISLLYATLQAKTAFIEVCQREVLEPFLQRWVSWTAATQTLHHVDATLSLLHRIGEGLSCYLTPLLSIWVTAFSLPYADPAPPVVRPFTRDPTSGAATPRTSTTTKAKDDEKTVPTSPEDLPHTFSSRGTSQSCRLFPVADIVWPAVCTVLQEKLSRSLFDTMPPSSFRRKYVAATSLEQKIFDLCGVPPCMPVRGDDHHATRATGMTPPPHPLTEGRATPTLPYAGTLLGWEERERIRCSPITEEWRRKWRVDIYATECVRSAAAQLHQDMEYCEGQFANAVKASQAYVTTILHPSPMGSFLPVAAPYKSHASSSSSSVSSTSSLEVERTGQSYPMRVTTPEGQPSESPHANHKDRRMTDGGGKESALMECWSGALEVLQGFWKSLRGMFVQLFSQAFLPCATSAFLRQCVSSAHAIAAVLHHTVGESMLSALTSPSYVALAWGTALPAVTAFGLHDVLSKPLDRQASIHLSRGSEVERHDAASYVSPPDASPLLYPEEYHNVLLLTLFAFLSVLQEVRFLSSFLHPSGDACRLMREAIAGPEEEEEEEKKKRKDPTTIQTPSRIAASSTMVTPAMLPHTEGVTIPIASQCVAVATWCGNCILEDHYTPLWERLEQAVLMPACLLPLQHIRSVRATFSHTQSAVPSTPSWYVSSVWQPCTVFRRAWDVQQEARQRRPTLCPLFRSTTASASLLSLSSSIASPSTTTTTSSSLAVSPVLHAAMVRFRQDGIHILHRIQLAVWKRFTEVTTETLEAARKADEGWEKLRRRREATAAAAEASNASIHKEEKEAKNGPTEQWESSTSTLPSPAFSPNASNMRLFGTTAAALAGPSDRDKMMAQLYLDAKEIIQKFALLTPHLEWSDSSSSSSIEKETMTACEKETLERYRAVQNELRQKERELLAMLQRGQSVLEEKMAAS